MIGAERGASTNTLQAYGRDIEAFEQHLVRERVALSETKPSDVVGYLQTLSVDGMAASSRARKLSTLRQLFKFMLAEALIEEDPAHGIAGPRQQRPLPKTLSIGEVDLLIEAAKARVAPTRGRDRVRAMRQYCLVELLYATGMRVSELVSLPRQVLDGDARVLTIKGKGGRERLVPLNSSAREALDGYLALGQNPEDGVSATIRTRWLFPSKSVEGHVTRQRFAQELKSLALGVKTCFDR